MLHHPQPLSEWKLPRFRFIQAALYWNANSRLHAMWKRQEEMINHLSVTGKYLYLTVFRNFTPRIVFITYYL